MKVINNTKQADQIGIADKQVVIILKGKPYPPFIPKKTIHYKIFLTPNDILDLYNYIVQQGYINGGDQNDKD